MTSRLRRKRPTTPRSTPLATCPSWAGLAAWAAACLWGIVATAGEVIHDPAVAPCSYSTSQAGAKLRWLPPKQSDAAADGQTVMAAHLVPAGNDPFKDPFGDKKPAAAAAEPMPAFPAEGASPLLAAPVKSAQPPAEERNGAGPPKPSPEFEMGGREGRTMEQELAAVREDLRGKCPKPEDLKPIEKIKFNIRPEEGELPPECSLGERTFEPRAWGQTCMSWTASALCHKPLFFEDPQLERYGHSWGPYLQPFVSAGHFFISVPFMPYTMGLTPPNECIYTLGYYRPGSCAPYMLDPLPLSVRAALMEGGAITALVFLLP